MSDGEHPPGPGQPARPAADAAAERRRIRRSTAGFAVATIVSRVAGLVREVAVAAVFGVSAALSAFTVAFQIPNLIRSLVADAALNASFVPVFSELRERGERERAWRVASTVLMVLVVVMIPITVLAAAFAEQVVMVFVSSDFTEVELAANLLRIMLPTVLLLGISGIIVGILNAHDHFSVPALAPIAWNLVIIVGVAIIAPQLDESVRIHAYAIAVLVGTVVQVLLPIPWLRGRGGRIGLGIDLRDPALRRILILFVPVTVSLGLVNVQLLVNTYFSTLVPTSLLPGEFTGPAVVDRAFRLYMLPQGVFSVAVATVAFPALARLAARADLDGFRSTCADAIRQVWLLLVPAAALMVAVPEPLVRLLYQHGAFTAEDTVWVSAALRGFAVGLVFAGLSLLLMRAFFSLQRPRVPMVVAGVSLVVHVVLVALVHEQWGVLGITLATSATNAVGDVLLYLVLRRHLGGLDGRRTLRVVAASTLAAAAAGGATWLAWTALEPMAAAGLAQLGLAVALVTTACGATYAIGLHLTGTVPLGRIRHVLLRR